MAYLNIGADDRRDLDLDQECFGLSSCEILHRGQTPAAAAPAPAPAPTPAPVAIVPVTPPPPPVADPSQYRRVSLTMAEAGSPLAGWPAVHLIDQNSGTVFSSIAQPQSNNVDHLFIAAWSLPQPFKLRKLVLKARYYDGASHCFPGRYSVYVTNSINSAWVLLGTYGQQPVNGTLELGLSSGDLTYGVLIIPHELSRDNYGNFHFQMSEIEVYE
ncbi:MAG: hypothetical protein K2Q26_10230 [Bdellovibrionales bacterium]|nr:hypothetical protein [Bdellovibrionales bacterium]